MRLEILLKLNSSLLIRGDSDAEDWLKGLAADPRDNPVVLLLARYRGLPIERATFLDMRSEILRLSGDELTVKVLREKQGSAPCPDCNYRYRRLDPRCPVCHGKGFIPTAGTTEEEVV